MLIVRKITKNRRKKLRNFIYLQLYGFIVLNRLKTGGKQEVFLYISKQAHVTKNKSVKKDKKKRRNEHERNQS